jgi:hypothetical protein
MVLAYEALEARSLDDVGDLARRPGADRLTSLPFRGVSP